MILKVLALLTKPRSIVGNTSKRARAEGRVEAEPSNDP